MIGFAHSRNRVAGRTKQVFLIGIDKAFVGHFLHIGPGGKGLVGPGQHHAAHLVIGIGGLHRIGQFGKQFGIQRVHRVRPVEANQRHMVLDVDDQRFIGHVGTLSVAVSPLA